MKLFQRIAILFCIVASCTAHAGEQPTVRAKASANQPVAGEPQRLQGTWQGFMSGQEKNGTITITITGNSLHFHRDTNFWFDTTFTLLVGTDPRQLHATIKHCAPGQETSVGKVVVAIYKIGDGTLTLVPIGDADEEMPKNFEDAEDKGLSRYELRKIQPHEKKTEPPKTR